MRIRQATVRELPDVLNVLENGLLAVEVSQLEVAVQNGDVLVAVAADATETDTDPQIVGALALDGQKITAVAVRRRRRGQGIGTRLVETASTRRDTLVAEFDDRVRPFWESLGFEIEPVAETDRFRGQLWVLSSG